MTLNVMIPKRIHQVIIVDGDDIPELSQGIKSAMMTFNDKNPTYEYKLYSGKECIQYIKDNYDEEILYYYNQLIPYAFKADFIRYLILYNEGGWYADSKMVCNESFDNLPKKELYLCLDADINPNCMANGFMASVPKHPIIKKCIDTVMFNIKQKHYGINCLYVTGPGVLFSSAIDYIRSHNNKTMLGKHLISPQNRGIMVFDNKLIVQVKYNNPKEGGIYSDVKGGNDYGNLWRAWQVYY